jgi:hypothetical protein
MHSTISSGRGASAIITVTVSKWSIDQTSSLCPSGKSMGVPATATLAFEGISDLPPPTAARTGSQRETRF